MENYKKVIGGNVKKVRRENKCTQAELAEKIDVSSNYIGKLERGDKGARVGTLIEIANCFDIPLSYLANEEGNYDFIKEDEAFCVKKYPNIADIGSDKGYIFLRFVKRLKDIFSEYVKELESIDDFAMLEQGECKIKDGRMEEVFGKSNKSLTDMADKIGKSKEYIYNLKNDNIKGSVKAYMDICEEKNIPIDVIFAESLKNKTMASKALEKEIYEGMNRKEKIFLENIVPYMVNLFKYHSL